MPVMGGLEATSIILETLPKDSHPFIFAVTANVLQDERKKCFEAGMNEVISKPINQMILREKFFEIAQKKFGERIAML